MCVCVFFLTCVCVSLPLNNTILTWRVHVQMNQILNKNLKIGMQDYSFHLKSKIGLNQVLY